MRNHLFDHGKLSASLALSQAVPKPTDSSSFNGIRVLGSPMQRVQGGSNGGVIGSTNLSASFDLQTAVLISLKEDGRVDF
jgi:hypothetical protein